MNKLKDKRVIIALATVGVFVMLAINPEAAREAISIVEGLLGE